MKAGDPCNFTDSFGVTCEGTLNEFGECETDSTSEYGSDPELARLLREEEMLEREAQVRSLAFQAEVNDADQRRAASDWTRMTTTVFVTSDPDLKARFFRLYERDTHADDVAYWKFNYAQQQIIARRNEKVIAKLERKLLKAQIKLAKQRVFDLESALDRMENPYGY